MSDHLGNIRATFSDMKLVAGNGWMVDLTSAASYYPFGMEIPGRTWNNGTGYRYGWGGHEKDNEVKGEGNSIATHFRLNDPRTGRWFTTDPVTHFSQSPYVSMDNNPVNLFDPNGADVFSDIGNWVGEAASDIGNAISSAYNSVSDFLGGTADSPLGPGSNGLFKDIGNLFNSTKEGYAIIEEAGIKTYFLPASNPNLFENESIVPGDGYYSHKNYFGEESTYKNPDWELGLSNLYKAINSFGHENYEPNYNFSGEIVSYDGYIVSGIAPDFTGVTKWTKGESVYQWIRSLWKSGAIEGVVKTGIQLEKSVANVMSKGYKTVGEVTVPIKNTGLLSKLNATSKGDWVKVYEAGLQNGSKIETHYFRNNTTGQVFDVKTKYNYWHQKSFKKLEQ